MRDKNTGNFMGYGFIEFENKEEASEALQLMNGKPMPNSNKVFKLNWASYSQSKSSSSQNPNEYSIYVCELDPSVNEEILQKYFSQFYKSVIGTKIVVDPSTKVSKGYGFVKFSDYNESQRALTEMNGQLINGKPMKINTAAYKKNVDKKNFNNLGNNNINNNLMYDGQALYNISNEPNLILQQQYLNQLYLNGYYNPYYQAYAQLYSQLQSMTPEQQKQYLYSQLQEMNPEQQQQFLMMMGYQFVGQSNETENNNTNNNNGNTNQ